MANTYNAIGTTADEFITKHGHSNLCGLVNLPANLTTHDELKNYLIATWGQNGIVQDKDGILVTMEFGK